jgi:O-acetyl-ADP-ribose deacetylase (regulator of RNase III)
MKIITKDITTVDRGIIAHGVNCQHTMGSGVAAAIRRKWPKVYDLYKQAPRGKTMLGAAQLVPLKEDDSLFVVNCYTQVFYGTGGRFADVEAIRKSLGTTLDWADYYDLPLYLPKIGCGLGGLNWSEEVRPTIERLENVYPRVEVCVCSLEDE